MMPNETHHQTDEVKMRALPWALASNVFNTLFVLWTFSGSVFLLFLQELGLPKGQMGVLLSLFPFCGVLALWFAPVATRWGWKRTFLWLYGLRKLVMAGLLLLPWWLQHAGYRVAMTWLFAVILTFAVLRALAETACYPWEQQYIPDTIRGKYAGAMSLLCTLTSMAALGIAGIVIARGSGLTPYFMLLAIGCALGLLGVAAMGWVPGGNPIRDPVISHAHLANMLQALRDHNFMAYLGGLGAVTVGSLLFTSFLPIYMTEQLGVTPGLVVTLGMAGAIGSAASSLCWGWAADRVGSRPVLMGAVGMTLMIPIGWLVLSRGVPHTAIWCGALFCAAGITGTGIGIGANRLLCNSVVPREHSTAYMALVYAWMGLVGGMAPLLAGGLLTIGAHWQMRVGSVVADGYTLLYMLGLVMTAVGWWLYGRVRPDDRYTTRMVLRRLGQCIWLRSG